MIDKVYSILKKINPSVLYQLRPDISDKNEVLSFHFFNLKHGFYGDGIGRNYEQSLQVDIFHKKSIDGLDRKIIEELKKHNIKFVSSDEYVEDLSKIRLYHTVLIFNFIESEVR